MIDQLGDQWSKRIWDQRSTSSTGNALGKVQAKRDSRVIVRWFVAFSMNTSRLNTWRWSLIFGLWGDQRSNLDVHGREQNAKGVNLTDEITRLHLNSCYCCIKRSHLSTTIQHPSILVSDVKHIKNCEDEGGKQNLIFYLPYLEAEGVCCRSWFARVSISANSRLP